MIGGANLGWSWCGLLELYLVFSNVLLSEIDRIHLATEVAGLTLGYFWFHFYWRVPLIHAGIRVRMILTLRTPIHSLYMALLFCGWWYHITPFCGQVNNPEGPWY